MGSPSSGLVLERLHVLLLMSIRLGSQKPWVCSTVQCDLCILLTFELSRREAAFHFYRRLNKSQPRILFLNFREVSSSLLNKTKILVTASSEDFCLLLSGLGNRAVDFIY